MTVTADLESDDYDEFQFLEYHARWAGVPWDGPPAVRRESRAIGGQEIAFLRWGTAPPEVAVLHGAGQNAHTWDSFLLALGRPAVAVDLPGHGRSAWREDGDYSPEANAVPVAGLLAEVAPTARAVVGFSLGGLTAIRIAATRPERVRALVVVDITPGRPRVDEEHPAVGPFALMSGPRRFPSWAALLEESASRMPHRSRESLVPGLRHNVRRFDDGTWGWRYDRLDHRFRREGVRPDHSHQWAELDGLAVPALFVKGGRSPIVGPAEWAELARRVPGARREILDSGHSVPSERPVELAVLVEELLTVLPTGS